MVFTARVVRVLIASPSDVVGERNVVEAVIHRWNGDHAEAAGVVLLPQRWEVNAVPQLGDRPQGIINRQLVDKSDMIIGVFWTRLGSPTGVADSGTAEEIERGQSADKPIALYFSNVPVVPGSVDQDQFRLLTDFKNKHRNDGLFGEFGDHMDLERSVSSMLTHVVRENFQAANSPLVLAVPAAPRAVLIASARSSPSVRGGSSHSVTIVNQGAGRAAKVTIEPEDPEKYWDLMGADEPIDYLPAGASIEFVAALDFGSPPRVNYIVSWVNEDGSLGENRFTFKL